MIRYLLITILALLIACALVACWSSAPPATRDDPVPSAREAERLRASEPPAAAEARELRSQELVAERAAAEAIATGDPARAAAQRSLAAELARIRAGAEQREREQRQAIAARADEADRRAQAERAELDQRAAAAERVANARQAERQRQSDRRWAGWGLALAAVAGIALRILALPAILSVGGPAAIAAGCLTLAAWSSVPWLATVLGIVLAGGLALALAVLARHLIAEWSDYATRLGAAQPDGRTQADAASRARQPAWVRWLLDRVLPARRIVPSPVAAPVTPAASA